MRTESRTSLSRSSLIGNFLPRSVSLIFWTEQSPMWLNLQNIVVVIKLYIQRMQISVLFVYCCAISQCAGTTVPGVSIFLGGVARLCDEVTKEGCSTRHCLLSPLAEATRLTGCPPCPRIQRPSSLQQEVLSEISLKEDCHHVFTAWITFSPPKFDSETRICHRQPVWRRIPLAPCCEEGASFDSSAPFSFCSVFRSLENQSAQSCFICKFLWINA